MGWFWKKKPASPADAMSEHVVAAAMAQSHRSDREWRELQERQQREEKQREKEIARAAKEATKAMKKQVKAAKKEQKKEEQRIQKQANTMRRLQKRELKAERKAAKKQAKAIKVLTKKAKRTRREEDKRRKRVIRQRKKEEKKRRKQLQNGQAQAQQLHELERQRIEAERETERLRTVATPAVGGDGVEVREAPKFKESATCSSCTIKFKRLPMYRRHHCRNCGESFCSQCLSGTKRPIPWFKLDKPQKVCFTCDVQVFNGMGGVKSKNAEEAQTESPSQTVSEPAAVHAQPPPLYRSASSMSEQPEDDSPRSSSRGSRRFISLRPRSRRDQSSSKSSKKSLWTLPIRPLLKRKESADRLRNRAWDLDLHLEKHAMIARPSPTVVVNAPRRLAPAV